MTAIVPVGLTAPGLAVASRTVVSRTVAARTAVARVPIDNRATVASVPTRLVGRGCGSRTFPKA